MNWFRPVLLIAALAAAGAEGPKMPEVARPVMFNTPEADKILAALQVFPPDNPWNEDVSTLPVHPKSEQMIAGMRSQPGWAAMEAIAPTLAYDDEILAGSAVPRDLAPRITVPVLFLGGGASPQSLQRAAKAAADAFPTAAHRTLDGQTHDVSPDALAPVLIEFFTD